MEKLIVQQLTKTNEMNVYPRLSEISEQKRSHLAWRLDNKTYVGYGTACRIARIEMGNMRLNEVFEKADCTPHSAKIHARKVINHLNQKP